MPFNLAYFRNGSLHPNRLGKALLKNSNEDKSLRSKPEPLAFLINLGQALEICENHALQLKNTDLIKSTSAIKTAFIANELTVLRLTHEPKEQMEKLEDLMKRLKIESPYKVFAKDAELPPIIANELNKAIKQVVKYYDNLKSQDKVQMPRRRGS